ncbi:MAG: peptidyl-prolyl cis-trans isomerase, partial [Stenotrophobium sp.]
LMDDAVVRRQLELRMRETLLREHPEAEPDDAALAAFLAAHADGYQAAARYSFDQVYLSRGAHGAGLTSAANAIAAQLRAHPESYAALGDPFPRGKQLQSLTAVQIEADFGHTLAQDISTQPQGAWQGPLESPLGLHFVRVIAITPARTLTLAEARARLRVDYLEDRKRGVLRAALVQLRQEFSGTAPPPRPARTDEDIP